MNQHRFRGFVRYMEPDRGFGGWLMWFFISSAITVFGEGRALVRLGEYLQLYSASHMPNVRTVLAIEVLRTLIRVIMFSALVIGLWLFAHEDRRSPAFWTAYFVAVIPLNLAFAVLGVAVSALAWDVRVAAAVRIHAPEAYWPIAVAVAWGLYWRRSRRVRNTYGYTGWRWPPPTGEPEYWPA
jgi:hypothetical protein